jgi:hypothetical protein
LKKTIEEASNKEYRNIKNGNCENDNIKNNIVTGTSIIPSRTATSKK